MYNQNFAVFQPKVVEHRIHGPKTGHSRNSVRQGGHDRPPLELSHKKGNLRHRRFRLYRAPKSVNRLSGGPGMAEYKHGSMDVTEQEKTFSGLIKGSALVIVVSAVVLIFLAIVGT